jgi:hypothetical protein
MTTDTTALAARMRVVYLSLLAAAGCTAPGQPAVEKPTVDPTPKIATKTEPETKVEAKVEPETTVEAKVEPETKVVQPDPTPVTKPPPVLPTIGPGPVLNMPSCPSGTWSGAVAEVKKYAAKGSKTKLGCPDELQNKDGRDVSLTAERKDPLPGGAYATLDDKATKALGDGKCSYTWVIPCPGGRPLLTDDSLVRADVTEGTAWLADLAPTRAIPEALRTVIVAGWLLDARSEHASVASFARATLELMALAAPPALIAETQRASLDEVEHARLCFALASRCGGVALGPGPLPAVAPRPAELVHLACDTFLEGCVGETIAALAAARAARGCDDPTVAGVLRQIADDEARHAALAWATVAWAFERGGEPVRAAVRALAGRLRADALSADAPAPHPSAAALARHGRLDAAGQHACTVDAWQGLIPDALAELLGEPLTAATS